MQRLLGTAGSAVALTIAANAVAATNAYAPVAELVRSFMVPAQAIGWEALDSHKAVKWLTPGPLLLKTAAPDGSSFSRPGLATIQGHTFSIAASGSRAGVGSLYFSEAVPAVPVETVVAGLTQAGFALSPMRCPRNRAGNDGLRGWYHLKMGPLQANLYIGRLSSGRQGYTLFFADLPPMTQEEAANFVDCANGVPTQASTGAPATGQAGVVAVIEALMRPTGSRAALPWHAPLPAITWRSPAPLKFGRAPYSAGGEDNNPNQMSGEFKTPTTTMTVTATGNTSGPNRFYLEGGINLPTDAVFEALRRDGYAITAVTCGKPYTKMSENWFRIAAPGKQPAILYRSMSIATGQRTESYAVRLDNVAPALLPGQRPANGGSCPG